MDWKTIALLTIFASSSALAFFLKKISRDLIFFIGGASTLLVGITPARAFMENLTDAVLLMVVLLFVILAAAKEFLLDRNLRFEAWRDWIKQMPREVWMSALAGFLFLSAFEVTPLPAQVAQLLASAFGENLFLLLALFMLVIYLLARFFPALMILLLFFPFLQQTLEFCIPSKDATIAALIATFCAAFVSSLNMRVRHQFHLKARLPVLILFFLLCTFLIPQFFLK